MVSGTAGINYRIQKANRTDGRVQNLAVLVDKQALARIHKRMKCRVKTSEKKIRSKLKAIIIPLFLLFFKIYSVIYIYDKTLRLLCATALYWERSFL